MKLLLYIFLYCNAYNILNELYLSKCLSITNNILLQDNKNFYYSFINQNIFALCIYSIYIIKIYIQINKINKYSIALAFVYIKYILTSLLTYNMTFSQHELSRNIMWLFSTPLMLKMYCDINNLKLRDIDSHYHIIPTAFNIFIYPHKNTSVFYYFTGISWILILIFIKKLQLRQNLTFTNVLLFIWGIFMCLNIIDLFELTNIYNITLYYLYADTVFKIITNIIVNDYYEKQIKYINNMDLQSIQFISYIIKNIKSYNNDNAIITPQCKDLVSLLTNTLLVKIPKNTIELEKELLKKILPFGFDKDYITNSNENIKQFDMVCVLFTDIVNYTELSSKYDDKIIFQMLFSIYTIFDNTLKIYPHIQKIETIGDAYMVVGDIFRKSTNYKIVIKEIILFALDILKQIKTIKTPDNIPLSLRIGINIGSVSIGILGNEIPRLCVVGNTVNIASRLQSTADIGTIQFSKNIYEQLEEINFDIKFEIIKKENVFLKNIGSIETYNIHPFL